MLRIFLLNLFIIVNLFAVVYEDAEDVKIDGWKVVSPKFQGKISNVFDEVKTSRVIKLDGNGIKSIYQLVFSPNLENIKMDKSFFTWEMNYSENFVIFIAINTIEGKRYLIYTPGNKNSYLQYGLNSLEKGKWQKYSRNLEKDLQIYEKDNKIIEIESFVIKGSGLLDNIKLENLNTEVESTLVKENIKNKKDNAPLENYENDILPVLKLKGKNPLVLKVGEEYIEAGAIAKNRDGTDIDIKITNNIDILSEGEYTVIYIATNKLGNSSIEKRQVVVGKVSKKLDKKLDKDVDDDIIDNLDNEDLTFPKNLYEPDMKGQNNQDIDDEALNNNEEVEEDTTRPIHPGL